MNRSLDPAALATPQPTRPMSPCLLPAIVSGLLLYLCYFPVAWGWLSWIALVPLCGLVRAQARPRRIYWSAYVGGLCFFVPVIAWMRVADYRMVATWLMLAAYCALYFPAGLWLIRLLDRRSPLPLALSVPVVWVALEWLRSFALTGFAWYYLGHAQHRFESIIQVADLGGVYAISFVVAAVNGLLADLLYRMPAVRDFFRWTEPTAGHASAVARIAGGFVPQALFALGLVVAAVIYGSYRLDEGGFELGPRVAMLQGNIDVRIQNQDARAPGSDDRAVLRTALPDSKARSTDRSRRLAGERVSLGPLRHPRRLPLDDIDPEIKLRADRVRSALQAITREVNADQLIGLTTVVVREGNKKTRYGSAQMLHKNGTFGERFDKMHRVPFGEYVPFRDALPFMEPARPL